jgi:hypothetical protein
MENTLDRFLKCILDWRNGRCAVGVLMSYFGLDGKDDYNAASGIFAAIGQLKYAGIDEDLLINLNDSGYSFDEIAEYLDKLTSNNLSF